MTDLSSSQTTPETDARDLARGAGVNYVGYIARLGSRVPFIFLAGLLYGEARFGAFTFGISVVETAAALATFGMRRSVYKFMSDEIARTGVAYRAVTTAVAVTFAAAVILALALAAGAHSLAGLFNLETAGTTLRILSAAIPLIVLSEILLAAIRFTRQMRFDLYARSLAEPITLTVVIVLAYLAGAREHGLAIGYVASLAAAALLSAFFFTRIYSVRKCVEVRPRRSEMREMIAFSAPTAGYEVLAFITDRVDIFLVSYFMPASAVGVYGMARQFTTVTKKIRLGFDRILAPVVSASLGAGERARAAQQIALVSRWIFTAMTAVVALYALWGDDLLGLMGAGFATGATVLVLLSIGDAINGSLGVSDLPFVFLRPFVNVVLGVGMFILAVAANVWLIGAMGLEGAAVATILTVTVVNAARIYLNRRLFGLTTVAPSILKPLVALVPALGVVLALQRLTAGVPALGIVLGIPALAVTYLGALYVLGLEPEDREQLDRVRAAFRSARHPTSDSG
jgi:O-antigen/teichoic acid export membrane protein